MLAFVGVLGLVTVLLTAFGSGSPTAARAVVTTVPQLPTGRPKPTVLATVTNLRIQLPVAESALTAIGFHGARNGALSLTPLGRQANQGLLARIWHSIAGADKKGPEWFQLGGRAGVGTRVLNIGAAVGSDVYAPVGGEISAISAYVVSDRVVGARIDIRPTDAPSVIVSLTHVKPDPSLAVGTPVAASSSKLGTVVDMARYERQALARHTRDVGNNVAIEVYPAATSLP